MLRRLERAAWASSTKPKTLASTARPLVSPAIMGDVSPDGEWIAYGSRESGTGNVYVRPFPDVTGGQWQISRGGGGEPRWTQDGRELIYLTADSLVSVPVETEPSFRHGNAETIFEWNYHFDGGGRSCSISPNGERFLVVQEVEEDNFSTELVVVLNWFEELKRLAPADK